MNATRTRLLLELQEVNGKIEAAKASVNRASASLSYYIGRKSQVVKDLREVKDEG